MPAALLVIDVQNDYFPGGAFPLWNTEETLANITAAVEKAQQAGVPVVHIQHLADPAQGLSPFFNADTPGAAIHDTLRRLAPDAPMVTKHFADSFEGTNLAAVLDEQGVDELLVCGMMTQNCVTHTAISRAAERYRAVTILPDCCTTVNEMIHLIGLHAVSTRVQLTPSAQVFA